MSDAKNQNSAALVGLGLTFVFTMLAAGGMVGGLYVRFLMPRAPDGWTGIARGLGGLMVGGGIGLVLALVLLVPLTRRGTRAMAKAAVVAFVLLAISFLTLYKSNPQRGNQPAHEPPRPMKPTQPALPLTDQPAAGADADSTSVPPND